MAPYFLDDLPVAVAHRGGGAGGVENTLAAFRRATELGYRYLETDVRVTRDGVLIVHHDPTLAATTGHHAAVADLPWSTVARLRVAAREPIPRLADVLAALPQARFVIDAKVDAAVRPLVAAVVAAGAVGRVCVSTFAGPRTAVLRRALGPTVASGLAPREVAQLVLASRAGRPARLAALGRRLSPATAEGGATGPRIAQVPQRWRGVPVVDARLVAAAHALGVRVQVWTVNDAPTMHRLLDLGVDGIITDDLETLRAVLAARGCWAGG